MDSLPRKMHLCTHMHDLGGNFRRFLGPLESMNSQGWSQAGLLWEGDPEGSWHHQSFAQDHTA